MQATATTIDSEPESTPVNSRNKVVVASLIGTAIEFFDFYIYATAAVIVFPNIFFPQGDPTAATLQSLATFAIAFVARPIGSAVFGHFGDRVGRKATLVASLLTMGISTVVIGLLPGYATIGIFAPLLLALARFGQGLGLGGEWGGAALLAAIMSTVSSQLLVASSSLTEDIYRTVFKRGATERELVNVGRLAVLAVGAVAVLIASNPDSEVLGLVANAWAGFGAAFGPLIVLALTWKRMTGAGAVAGLVTGAVVVIAWIALGLSGTLYEIVPGFIASWIAIVLVSLNTPDRGEYRAPKNA